MGEVKDALRLHGFNNHSTEQQKQHFLTRKIVTKTGISKDEIRWNLRQDI